MTNFVKWMSNASEKTRTLGVTGTLTFVNVWQDTSQGCSQKARITGV